MKTWLRVLLILVCLLGICAIPASAQTPAVPSDKLAWDMKQDTAGMTFALEIDGQRSPPQNATCGAPVSGSSLCTVPLPAMSVGVHTIKVIAVLTAGATSVESAPSQALSVSYIAVVTPDNVRLIKGV